MKKISLSVFLVAFITTALIAGGKKEDGEHLLKMVASGKSEKINKMLKTGMNLDTTDDKGRTALHIAVETEALDIVSLLISQGAEKNIQDNQGRTPLLIAVNNDNLDAIRLLSDAGADFSIVDKEGNSPASVSLLKPINLLRHLVNEKNVNNPAIDGQPLLHTTARLGLYDYLEILLDKGADTTLRDNQGFSALDSALTPKVSYEQILSATAIIKAGSLPPQNEDWLYILEPVSTNNLNIRSEEGAAAMHHAAEHNHIAMIQYLIRNGAEIETKNLPGDTALHIAIRNGYGTVAKLLIDAGVDVDEINYSGNAPLHDAQLTDDRYALSYMLLNAGANPDIRDADGNTPLHLVSMLHSEIAIARLLLNRGALIGLRNKEGSTPLLLAVEARDRELSELFIENGADIFARNSKALTPAQRALSYGVEFSSWFFADTVVEEVDNVGRGVLHMAAAMRVPSEILAVVLNTKVNPNLRDYNGNTALHYALVDKNIPLAVTLVNYGSNVFIENNDGESPLIHAFNHGPEFASQFLIRIQKPIDREGNTPIFHAIRWQYPDVVQAILDTDEDTTHQNLQGNTMLHEAAHAGSSQIAVILLNAGANPNATDNIDRSPIHHAVIWGTLNILKLCVEKGGDIDLKDAEGQTVLHMAASAGNNEILSWLLSSQVGSQIAIDSRDSKGQTALFLAAKFNKRRACSILLENGANLLTRDRFGRTALHAALAAQSIESSRVLIEAGGDMFALDSAGQTPFDLLMIGGMELLSGLMDRELLDNQDNMGNTLLHRAILSDASDSIIHLLISSGADKEARNAAGASPLDLAREMGRKTIIPLLSM